MTAFLSFPGVNGQLAGWNRLVTGGGGYVTGGDISADGLRKIHWGDVFGVMIKDSTDTKWRYLTTTNLLPAADSDPPPNNDPLADGLGGFSGAIAPSNKDIIGFSFNAFLYRTANGGGSIQRMALPAKRMLANTGYGRLWNKKLSIHPTDPNIWIIGTNGDGIHYTTNAHVSGGTWVAVSGVPAGAVDGSGNQTPHLTAFDPGAPDNVFISRNGTGIYRSTAGVTGSFALVTGGPTTAATMIVDALGTLWVCTTADVDDNLWKLARGSSTWVNVATPGSVQCIAVNPANTDSIVAINQSGPPLRSINRAATWVNNDVWYNAFPAPIGIYTNATDIPWLGGHVGLTVPSHIQFDPVATNKLWIFKGDGIAYSNPPSTYVRWDWYDETLGNEELVFNASLSIPGNTRPLFGAWDKPIWRPLNLDYARGKPLWPGGEPEFNKIVACWSMDWAAGASNYVVANAQYFHQRSGYSQDGGETWSAFAAQHPGGNLIGGCIASTGENRAIWVPGGNGKMVRTSDSGVGWVEVNMGGSTTGVTHWVSAPYVKRNCITADKERPGYVIALVNTSVTPGETQTITGGVYRSNNHGIDGSWTRVFTGVIDPTADGVQFWHNDIRYIPGKSGELLFCAGRDFNSKIKHSSNDGADWVTLRSGEIDKVRNFGFGKKVAGQTYPVVVFDGEVNGVRGIYRSRDFFATTPTLLGERYPLGIPLLPHFVGGDMNVEGRFYMSPVGNGLAYGNFA